jgi:hypothetical protein
LGHGFITYLPHNDWLRIRFNYGWMGVGLYIATMSIQVLKAWPKATTGDPRVRAVVASGLSCFVPYAAVMFTDNVLIYCQFFTVPMMLLVATGYAVGRRSRKPFRRQGQPWAASPAYLPSTRPLEPSAVISGPAAESHSL